MLKGIVSLFFGFGKGSTRRALAKEGVGLWGVGSVVVGLTGTRTLYCLSETGVPDT